MRFLIFTRKLQRRRHADPRASFILWKERELTEFFQRILNAIITTEKVLAVLAFIAMLLALLADIIGREVFGQGVFGSVRFAVYAMIMCAMAGFGIATASGAHLRPQFLDFVAQGRAEMPARRLGQLASVAILVMLAIASLEMIAFSRTIEDHDLSLGWLVWPIQLILPVAFMLSAVRHLIYAVCADLMPLGELVNE